MKFVVDKAFFELVPDACFGVVVARGIDNGAAYPNITRMLGERIEALHNQFEGTNIKENEAILPYRNAFNALGINPNKFLSSIEAMTTRVAKGKGLPSINPIVDLGNSVSLKYLLPIGAHDLGLMPADIEVRLSTESDVFTPFGESECEQMPAGEAVYATGNQIRTRRWIWRQSELGKITETSRDIFFPIDGFAASNREAVLAARDELEQFCRELLGVSNIAVGWLDSENPSMEL